MKRIFPITTLAIALFAAGCHSTPDSDTKPRGVLSKAHGPLNSAMLQAYELEHVDNAVIRQHTIYPYHFEAYSAELNDLGRRDVYVLAMHFKEHPGPLNVNRGDASNDVYTARVNAVKNALTEAGFPADKLSISDGLPGGDGITSDRVVLMMEKESEGAKQAKQAKKAGDRSSADTGKAKTGETTVTTGERMP